MTDELLAKAVESLAIADVFPRSVHVRLSNDFQPKYSKDGALVVQWKFAPSVMNRYSLNEDGEQPNEARDMVSFNIDTVIRFLRPGAESVPDSEKDALVVAQMDACFCAEYRLLHPLEQEHLEVYAHRNVMYHVWPYWRELIHTEMLRLRLPGFTLPVFRLPKRAPQIREPLDANR